jgi:hypothetical protein
VASSARDGAESDALCGDRRGDVATFGAVPERRDVHGNHVAHLDHLVAVAGSIHVVRAVALELDVSLALGIGHLEDQPHVRVDSLELLDDTGDRH